MSLSAVIVLSALKGFHIEEFSQFSPVFPNCSDNLAILMIENGRRRKGKRNREYEE